MPPVKNGTCVLCARFASLTFHHLIPRSMHSNKWFKKNFTRDRMMEGLEICRDCHSAIHQAIEEKSLARNYNTLEALRSHPEVSKFIDWVSNKDTNRVPMRSWRERKKSRR